MDRLAIWRGLDDWRAEAALIRIADDRLTANGTQLGETAEPYQLDYTLRTGPRFITESLELSLVRAGALRRLHVVREPDGNWRADNRPLPELDDALDCDLGLCPLTNTMPVLRDGLLEPG